jgi:GGDEF domain-containing protein
MMPQMDGIELTRALRQTKIGRSIYVLILTGLEDEEKLVEAFEAGVDDFMNKPLKARVLAARLRAGQRVVQLQQEIERDREEIRKFAAELAVTNRRLQVALTDALTGFPNRRYAMERISQEWSAGNRTKRPLACMVVDVDAFKIINDTYGHDVGDGVEKNLDQGRVRGPWLLVAFGDLRIPIITPRDVWRADTACGRDSADPSRRFASQKQYQRRGCLPRSANGRCGCPDQSGRSRGLPFKTTGSQLCFVLANLGEALSRNRR